MTTERIRITYGSDMATMEWDGAQASAPIVVNGEPTQYQTADARHRTDSAVRLACAVLWGPLYETEEEAAEAGLSAGRANICVWDDVEYETIEDEPGDDDA